MKKSILFLGLLVCSLHQIMAQEPVSVVGPVQEQKETDNTRFIRMLTSDLTGTYMLKESGTNSADKEFYISKVDPSFNPVYTKRLSMTNGVMGDQIFVHSVIVVKGKIFLLKEGFKKAITKGFMNVYSVNADGEVSATPKELDSFTAEKLSLAANYSVSISQDESKIVVLAKYPAAKDVNEKVRLHVFDSDFNELWTKEIIYDHPSKGSYANDVRINNAGDVFILKKMIGEQSHTYYKLYTCSSNGTVWKENKVNTGVNFVSEHTFKLTRSGNAVVAGVYAVEMKWQDQQYGTFFFSVNPAGEVIAQKTDAFTETFLKDIQSRTFKKITGERYVVGLIIKDLLERSDGNMEMITEYFKHETQSISSSTPGVLPVIQKQDTYGEILVHTFTPEGNIVWFAKIYKDQYSKMDNSAFSSFIYTMVNDRLLIFYNQVELLYYKDKTSGLRIEYQGCTEDTYYKSFFLMVQADGTVSNLIPLVTTYNRIPFKMSLNPHMYYMNQKDELYFMIEMLHHKRYAFGMYKL